MRRIWLGAAVVAALFGCGKAVTMDLEAEKKALMQADLDFAKATAESGTSGWVSYFAEDGRQLARGGQMPIGHREIREMMEPFFGAPGRKLEWHPVEARVSGDATMGYTIGEYTASGPDSSGVTQVTGTGRYVSIWRKQADGTWKVAVDLGAPDEP
jgi:uncharacterized protein (TIGR02246 family)